MPGGREETWQRDQGPGYKVEGKSKALSLNLFSECFFVREVRPLTYNGNPHGRSMRRLRRKKIKLGIRQLRDFILNSDSWILDSTIQFSYYQEENPWTSMQSRKT